MKDGALAQSAWSRMVDVSPDSVMIMPGGKPTMFYCGNDPAAKAIVGTVIDDTMEDRLRVLMEGYGLPDLTDLAREIQGRI